MTDPQNRHDLDNDDKSRPDASEATKQPDSTPRGNPPADEEAVRKGRDVLERVKPY